ncbi:hypothetical protein J4444_01560 [Candidatus Woesearchaeota archaeon]|nr:hypothetical protein [Candidatus Woesearchaeota archaeon]
MATKRLKSTASKRVSRSSVPKTWHPVYLKGSFMIIAIIGFFVSAYMIYPNSTSFGFTFMFLFTLMFIASIISMTKAPIPKSEMRN